MLKPSVILMGSKPGSVVALKLLLESKWDIKYIVTTPDIKHDWIEGEKISDLAKKYSIPEVTQDKLPLDIEVDFVISYMFRKLVKKETRDLARRGALNFHAGPLPEYGGWAFYNIAILENDNQYGCTCHYMDDGFDTGPLLKVRRFPIDSKSLTAISLEKMAQSEMIKLFIDFMNLAEGDKELPFVRQEKSRMRYLKKEEFMKLKAIPNDADEETIDRYARAFWYPPYDCAYILHNGVKIELVPKIAKEELAVMLQKDSYNDLLSIADEYKKEIV